jgi:hypothetical protein
MYFLLFIAISGKYDFLWCEDTDSKSENEDVAETCQTSLNIQKYSHPSNHQLTQRYGFEKAKKLSFTCFVHMLFPQSKLRSQISWKEM